MRTRTLAAGAAALALAFAASCRESDGDGLATTTIVPSSAGSNGCTGPEQAFSQPPTPLAGLTTTFGPLSQIAAAGDAELLFATAANAGVVAIDVSGGAPVETTLVSPGTVATLLAGFGIAAAPQLSGIAVLDAGALLVMEHTSNCVLRVDRAMADSVQLFAGEPNVLPGFADGLAIPGSAPAAPARFAFDLPAQLCPTGASGVFVADPGNHALRAIAQGFVSTVAGTGAAFFSDGSLQSAAFDTPSGLSVSCSGTLLITERGAAGAGGQRLRRLILGTTTFFGTTGTVLTVAGDGTEATVQGQGELASLAAPVSPVATQGEEVYWIDSAAVGGTAGILRRLRPPGDTVDCPLWPDCAAAIAGGGDFTGGGAYSLVQTPSGALYALDAGAGTLYRVAP